MYYESKVSGVEARQHVGAKIVVVSHLKGEQTCESGDFLVTDPDAVQRIREQEKFEKLAEGSLPLRGTVYVIAKAEFRRLYVVKDEKPEPAQSDAEHLAAQDAHDRETGNVNGEGLTPHEAIQAEETQQQ